MKPAALLLPLLLLLTSCGARMQDRVRMRAAADLSCPADRVHTRSTGLGGWQAAGCGLQARYVCSHSVCALEGEIAGTRVEPPTSGGAVAGPTATPWEVGAWRCYFFGASVPDQETASRALQGAADALSECASESVAASVSATTGRVEVFQAGAGAACARAALAPVVIPATDDFTLRCERREVPSRF